MADTKFKFCENCGRNVTLNGQLCARCGADLSEQQVIRSSRDPTATQQGLTAGAWNAKGVALANSNRYQKALQCFDNALEIDPRYADAWTLKGAALNELHSYQEALQCFDNAL